MTTNLWDDSYNAELSRARGIPRGRTYADLVEQRYKSGLKYDRWGWLRRRERHFKRFWWCYGLITLVTLAIVLPVTLVSTTPHYAGIPRNEVLRDAEHAALGWFGNNYDRSKRTFHEDLSLDKVYRTNRGPLHFWRVKFLDGSGITHSDGICVLLNHDAYYVSRC